MVVGVWDGIAREGSATVVRDVELDTLDVDAVVVLWIDADLSEVHRPRIHAAHLLPARAGIVRAVHPALRLVLDPRVHDVGVFPIDVHPDAAQWPLRDPLRQLDPRLARIAGLVDRATWPASVETPIRPTPLIGRGVEHLVVPGVHHEFGCTCVLVDEEHVRPRHAAVGLLVNAAFFVRPPEVSLRRDVDDIVIHRVDDDARYVAGVSESHQLPRMTAVDRLLEPRPPPRAPARVA